MRYFLIAMIAVGYAFWKLAIKPDLADRHTASHTKAKGPPSREP
jgi:hypothetical protein